MEGKHDKCFTCTYYEYLCYECLCLHKQSSISSYGRPGKLGKKISPQPIKVGWPTSGEAQTRTVSKMVESAHSRQIASQRKGHTWKFPFFLYSSDCSFCT